MLHPAMKYVLFLFLLPVFVFAQDQVELNVIPKPYNPKPYYDQLNHTGIKKVAIISKQKKDQFNNDTTYVYEYNEAGQQVSSARYEHNKVASRTLMKYDQNNNQVQWTILEPNESQTTTNFYYNAFNQLDSTRQVSTRQQKTTHTSHYAYQYENRKLMARQIIFNDVLNRDDHYQYRDNLLTEFKSIWNPEVYFLSKYQYNGHQQLTEVHTTHYFGSRSELWNKKNFSYDKGLLTSEEEHTYDNKKISNQYEYDPQKKLTKIVSTYLDNKQEIEFDYNEFGVMEITIKANSNSAYLKYYIPLGLENIAFPMLYKETFMYDSKHNFVGKKHYVNGELFKEVVYLVEYYK